MKRIKISQFIVFVLALFVLGACESETIMPMKVVLPDEPVLFSTQIQPIFDANCISCHSGQIPILKAGQSHASLTDGYVNMTNYEASTIYVKTKEGHPGGSKVLTPTQQALLLKWIEEGAKNN